MGMASKKKKGKIRLPKSVGIRKIKPCSSLKPSGAKQYEQFKNINCVIPLLLEILKYLGSI